MLEVREKYTANDLWICGVDSNNNNKINEVRDMNECYEIKHETQRTCVMMCSLLNCIANLELNSLDHVHDIMFIFQADSQ
jgi:hypothetical protein